ncbi:glutamyl-tRNA(Gln) amidotransferase subunit A, mitochondrial-like [Portunus trituberculatus]|nr:glutamyl-tRNA(Gln) amidotransferase subunit A, mitochondrial-like [Portunus trituberculatus]XP_045126366.1 glutamyl-tRNA(Gln) amidotransferase subunit A, mitochondrial-like [Portunus trituberculatus]XP_045126374.1 glutamyl-tRNA(Gln) amidotransferase subunit A, mitochondrial-like [Portunus trituberculatus]
MNLLGAGVGEVRAGLVQKVVSAVEVCEAAIKRQAVVSSLRPFITPTQDTAREAAQRAHRRYEEGKPMGPLDGIPVAIKDNFCTKGITTTCGSNMLRHYIPPYSATVVERLLSAGAVLVGKTNLDEFGMGSGTIDSSFGGSRNVYRSGIQYELTGTEEKYPTSGLEHDDWVVTGGSSGGSALSVATGTAFVALGSDTGGSVRNPSSYCGVVGFKPSYGLVPRWGLVSLVNSMDVPGLFGRHVDDVATLLSVVAGQDPMDSTSVWSDFKTLQLPPVPSLEGVVVGLPKEYHQPGTSGEVVKAWTKVADLMEDAGAKVREVSMPHTELSIICYSILNTCEVASNFTRYTGVGYGHRETVGQSMEALYALTRRAGFNEVVRGRVLAGNYFLLKENRKKYFEQALKVRRLIWQDFQEVWRSGVSLLLTPTTLTPAHRHSTFRLLDNRTQTAKQDVCTQSANMAGVGAVSVPVGMNDDGLPLALQLMAPWGQDAALLAAAKWIEQRVTFPRLRIL